MAEALCCSARLQSLCSKLSSPCFDALAQKPVLRSSRHNVGISQHWMSSTRRRMLCAVANGGGPADTLGDFGARDPFAGELESNFGTKVLGNADTEHQKLIPNVSSIVGLGAKKCGPLPEGTNPYTEAEARTFLRRVIGWKLVEVEGGLRIKCELRVKDFNAGLELFKRIAKVAEEEGHHPDLHLESWNLASVEIWSHSIGGLSENDFILAAKIDSVPTFDLVQKKKRTWF